MFKKTGMFLLSLCLAVSALAEGSRPATSQTQKAVRKAAQEAAIEQTSQAALNVDFYADHFTLEDMETENDVTEWESDQVTIYYYKSSAKEKGAFKDENNKYIIESKKPLAGRKLAGSYSYRLPRQKSSAYKYRFTCKAYALTDNWAVMSGNCLNHAFYTSSDNLFIPNVEYGKENILFGHEHEVKVQGAAVSSYYYSPEVILLYAAPGTPLVRKFANAPKVNVRIMDKPAQLPAVSSFKLVVNGKERTRKGQPKEGIITLDEGTFFKEVAGQATDGLFYQRNGKMFLFGFNEGRIHSILNKKGTDATYMREESSRYHVLSTEALNFMKAKTGKDWNASVRHHIYISK